MQFIRVTKDNIKDLYEINRQLAINEGQKDLFIASLKNYSKGFLGDKKIAYGILCYQDNNLIGFSICHFKFATYLGLKALYIEDIYLKKEYCSQSNKSEFLKHLIKEARNNNCCRVEMRVLKSVNWGVDLLNNLGLKNIDKWSVYRLSF